MTSAMDYGKKPPRDQLIDHKEIDLDDPQQRHCEYKLSVQEGVIEKDNVDQKSDFHGSSSEDILDEKSDFGSSSEDAASEDDGKLILLSREDLLLN